VFLLALSAVLVWLSRRGSMDSLTVSLHAGALSAVLTAAFAVGSATERAALRIVLSHPTSPLAVATGRWLGTLVLASLVTVGCAVSPFVNASVAATLAGIVTAAAVAGCALPLMLAAGRGAAIVLFLVMAVAGAVAPERLIDFAEPGLVRLTAASALELGPALWHYRDIATGDVAPVLHATAWAGLGVLLASAVISRQRR
jgi:hypothetical protein